MTTKNGLALEQAFDTRITAMREFAPKTYEYEEFDLATARTQVEVPVSGDWLTALAVPNAVYIQYNTKDAALSPKIDLRLTRRHMTAFSKFYLTNASSSGTLKLLIGKAASFEAEGIARVMLVDANGNEVSPVNPGATPAIYNVTMTLADTEYSQALGSAKKFTVHTRDGTAFRVAFATGKVATPTEPYLTIPANGAYAEDNIAPSALTL